MCDHCENEFEFNPEEDVLVDAGANGGEHRSACLAHRHCAHAALGLRELDGPAQPHEHRRAARGRGV